MEPLRTCIGCRKQAAKSEMFRVTAQNQQLVADLAKPASGRGAWVHPKHECLNTAVSRRAFNRALKADQALDTSGLSTHIEQAEMMLANK